MPLVSIVLPAYRVQAYLEECLDSILGQSFTDIEVLAVDDCSPDHTGRILDRYAERDPRVTVLHLPENTGLGPARNAGLARATGEYVWFVDSDDLVEQDCLSAIAERLTALRPDVLVVDHARLFWDQRIIRDTAGRILGSAPEVFRAEEHPDILRLSPCAWNKIVRRQYLTDLDIPFPKGCYEDVPFTYPLLAATDRIAVLDRACLRYRQRRHDSPLRTSGRSHPVLLNQYDLTFRRLAALGPRAEPLLPVVFDRAVDHMLAVLDHGGRVGDGHRRPYFLHASRLCARWQPAGYRGPRGLIDTIRYRLLTWGSWSAYHRLRQVYHLFRSIRPALRRGVRRIRRPLGRIRRRLRGLAVTGYYALQTRRPLDDTLAVYSIYWGKGYGCNAAAIYEKARELVPDVRGVWVVAPDAVPRLPAGVEHVVTGTAAYYRALARAKYLFNNVNFEDLVRKRPGSVHVQTHHGTPLKFMGVDQIRRPLAIPPGTDFGKLLERSDRWDFSISANRYSTQIWERAYPCHFESLDYGYPRNDVLSTAGPDEVARLRAELGIGTDERVVLYAPTHREHRRGAPTAPGVASMPLDIEDFARVLGPRTRLLVRAHHFHAGQAGTPGSERILDVSDHPRVEHLYLVSDMLITDYSSVMFDYAVLDRPLVIYAPDWETYRNVRGTYFDLTACPPGLVARSYPELVEAFRTGAVLAEGAEQARARFRRRFCAYDDGKAAERVIRRVFLDERPALPAGAMPRIVRQISGPTPVRDAELAGER